MQEPPRTADRKPDRVEAPVWKLETGALQRGGPSDLRAFGPSDHEKVRDLMWRLAGLFRTREGLAEAQCALTAAHDSAVRELRAAPSAGAWRHLHLVTVASLIARAALRREESRGGHFRQDFPRRDDARWRIHLTETRHDG
jgi:succinate dehydrogenase/fumarate reductase flavoprotein subunit